MTLDKIIRTSCLVLESKFSNGQLMLKLSDELNDLHFVGIGLIYDAYENCVEVFEIHQHLHRNGLLTTKGLN